MINKMIKKIIVVLAVALIGFSANGQSKFGSDSVACIENLSLFREYYKQKNLIWKPKIRF